MDPVYDFEDAHDFENFTGTPEDYSVSVASLWSENFHSVSVTILWSENFRISDNSVY